MAAAPLCKDLKGLFTPCPKELNQAAAKRLAERRAAVARASRKGGTAPGEGVATADAPRPKPRPKDRPPFVAGVTVSEPVERQNGKLCRDLKGLFTPCPR